MEGFQKSTNLTNALLQWASDSTKGPRREVAVYVSDHDYPAQEQTCWHGIAADSCVSLVRVLPEIDVMNIVSA